MSGRSRPRTGRATRPPHRAGSTTSHGLVDVKLPDFWATRWPGFDGVVWYRLSWQQARADTPIAALLDYLNMAGAIYLNGTLLNRDTNLAEPLTRARNTPRYLLLPAALLHQGTNTLLVRVSAWPCTGRSWPHGTRAARADAGPL